MKIAIIGPVVNDTLSGGVGVFDEGLYEGFKMLGDEVHLISVAKSTHINNIVAGKRPSNHKSSIFLRLCSIAHILRKLQPDLVVSSVQYSLGIKKYKRAWKKATYVQVLHGVAWPINGAFKAYCVNKVARNSRKTFDKVVTVSYLSYALNKQYNNIECDQIIHNGCDVSECVSKADSERIYDFLYIGRLYKDKQIELLIDAFALAKEKRPNLRLAIAGYGEMEYLFKTEKFVKSGIEFLGRIDHSKIFDLYKKSKCFISLHPVETFGIVFGEAILNGCNIVTQSTFGAIPLFLDSSYYHCCDCISAEKMADRIIEIIESEYREVDENFIKQMYNYLSYKRVASDYKKLSTKK